MKCENCKNVLSDNTQFCNKCDQKRKATTEVGLNVKIDKRISLLVGLISAVVFILAFVTSRYLTRGVISRSFTWNFADKTSRSERIADTVYETEPDALTSQSELIADTVRIIKASTSLPTQVDEITMLNDITAEPNAIRYHYTIFDGDTSNLTNDFLKSYLTPSLCQNKDTRYILDHGIGMEYSYNVQNSTKTYFLSFTKADCL